MGRTLLTISGSLRAKSSNSAVLLACADLAPDGVEVKHFSGLEALPHFNPDNEHIPHPAVEHWRREIASADALLICSPEYAHGIPGTLKNALDWIVGSAELDKKRIGVLNVTPLPLDGKNHAFENLIEVLKTMSGDVRPEFVLKIPEIRRKMVDEKITDEQTKESLRKLIAELNAF